MSGATVTIGGRTAATGNNGGYGIKVPRGGSYDVAVSAEGYLPYSDTVDASGASTEKNIILTAMCVISGKVTVAVGGNPIAGAAVTVGTLTTTTDDDGNYSVTLNRASSYDMTVSAEGYADYTGTVNAGGAAVTKDVALPDFCVVYGTVTSDYSGEPVEGALVTIGDVTVITGADGTYEMTVPRTSADLSIGAYKDKFVYAGIVGTSQDRNIKDPVIPDAFTVTGTVTWDISGRPVSDALVEIGGCSTNATAAGKYALKVPRNYLGYVIRVYCGLGDGSTASYTDVINNGGTSAVIDIVIALKIDNIADLKNAEVGSPVDVTFAAKAMNSNSDFADFSVYIESGVFEGYRLVVPPGADHVCKGDIFTFKGIVRSDDDGKYVDVSEITPVSSGAEVRTIGLTNGILKTNARVRIWGRVVIPGEDAYTVSFGCGEITVKTEKCSSPGRGDFVIITGIATKNGIRAIERADKPASEE